MPYILMPILCVHGMGWERPEPYAIMALALFIGRFNFKVGYAVAYCECNDIDLESLEGGADED